MPINEIIAGAALGLALQVIHEAIKGVKARSSTTACILDRLDATIFRITPLVVQIDKLMSQEVDGAQRIVIEDLKHLLEKAVSIVEAYAELKRRNLLKKFRYKRIIRELEATLRWMVDVDVQVNQWADIKELMAKMSEMNTKLDEITSQPADFLPFKSLRSITQSSNYQTIAKVTDKSSKVTGECSSDGSTKPKIDIHFRWTSRKRNKDREVRFVIK